MIDALKLKKWATPLIIGAFIVQGTSGLFMLFRISFGGMKHAHELFGFLLVTGGLLHITVNWDQFKKYFTKPVALAIISIFIVLGGLLFFAGPKEKEREGRPDFDKGPGAQSTLNK